MKRVVVIGDVMLDRYWHGVVERISPEAPVPVLRRVSEVCRPGGAANVAAGIAALSCDCWLYSAVGTDEAGDKLYTLLNDPGVNVQFQYRADVITTQKIRPVAGRHHMARIDIDGMTPVDLAGRCTAFADAAVQDVVVLSDYAHGMLANAQRLIKPGRRVLVDPKGTDWERYRGAMLVKPNRAELMLMVGEWPTDIDMIGRAQLLRKQYDIDNLLVTLGERGMCLLNDDGREMFTAESREVYDVCGAGDTVIATVAAMLAHGVSLRSAVAAANYAAGIVVGRFGTSTVSLEELGVRL